MNIFHVDEDPVAAAQALVDKHVVTIEKDPDTGDCFITIPDAILTYMGWTEGAILNIKNNNNGTITLESAPDEFSTSK